jgi:hypothetical protein
MLILEDCSAFTPVWEWEDDGNRAYCLFSWVWIRLLYFIMWALLLKVLYIFLVNPLNISPRTKNVLDDAVTNSYQMLGFMMRSNKVNVKDTYIHDKFYWCCARRATSKVCIKDEWIGSRGKSSNTCLAGNPQPLATQKIVLYNVVPCLYKVP